MNSRTSYECVHMYDIKKIIYRNRANLNDDIYVTGNLGDSFIGLQILINKIKVNKKWSGKEREKQKSS